MTACKIIPKGTLLHKNNFAVKSAEFKNKAWLRDLKKDLAEWINREIEPDIRRVVYDPFGPYLAQQHLGKGISKEKARKLIEWNNLV